MSHYFNYLILSRFDCHLSCVWLKMSRNISCVSVISERLIKICIRGKLLITVNSLLVGPSSQNLHCTRIQMETFCASLNLSADESPVTGRFPSQRVSKSLMIYLMLARIVDMIFHRMHLNSIYNFFAYKRMSTKTGDRLNIKIPIPI